MKATNKIERFADFINAMDFSEVIRFFNFAMSDMIQLENHAMYDYHDQEDAIHIIKNIGIENFLDKVVGNPTPEEKCVMYQTNGNYKESIDRWTYGINPWTEILDGYAEWILDHVEETYANYGNDADIIVAYPKLKEVIGKTEKFRIAVHKTLTKIVEVEAYSSLEALDWVNNNITECDPLMKGCDEISEPYIEELGE